MSEHRDDTTERDAPSPAESEPQPGSYYYDDRTGYEIYDPSKEDDDDRQEEEEAAGVSDAPSPGCLSRDSL